MSKVQKTEHVNNIKENLYNELRDDFCNSFKKQVKKLTDDPIDGVTKKRIAEDLEITEQTLLKYQTGSLPEWKMLPIIKQYFEVPYSTLFGEIDNEDVESALVGLNIGLNDNAIAKLKKMQANAMQDNYSTNYEDKLKIFLINCIINDDTLIDELSYTFAYYLGQIELKKKIDFINHKNNSSLTFHKAKNDYYLILLNRFISSIENRFDTLANSDLVTPQIKNIAYKIAEKYSGEYQSILKEK